MELRAQLLLLTPFLRREVLNFGEPQAKIAAWRYLPFH
jgi:hypothetical protein